MEAFTWALLAIPTTIADNAGLDSAELISQLRVAHQNEGCTAGIDVISGSIGTHIFGLLSFMSLACIDMYL
ncbi:TCP-1/cpn60 chaperonin family protein [Medicago truncatula]|uniref:TCP-1/cpn60 chaperonin family protein n=1 Tax=Medicago truncatula TaxID=3880 RepID=A0A072UXC6_MEDTR|nr:TCP-1/cpn60 chaperonin family protein [Medicago truncatula]